MNRQNEQFAHFHYSLLNITKVEMKRFDELLFYTKTLRALCIEGESLYVGFTNIAGDVWAAFYKPDIAFLRHLKEDGHYELIKKLFETKEYSKWKKLTELDELLAILTTQFFIQQVLTFLKDRSQIPAIQQNSIGKLKKSHIPNSSLFYQASMQIKQQDLAKFLKFSREESITLQNSIQKVCQLAGGKINQTPIKDQLQLAKELQGNSTLKQIADLTGKLKKIVLQKQKISVNTPNVRNITMGQDIEHLLPIELANYYHKTTRLDFLRRYSEHQTIQYDNKRKEAKGKGPIIFCIDESSSMLSIKNECKAFSLALLMIAKKQKRDMVVIPFAHDVGKVQYFKKGAITTEQLIHFCNGFLSGGTNYEKPLKISLDLIDKSEFNKADLLFLTDGSSFLPKNFIEEFNEAKKKRKCQCISIILTNYFNAVDKRIVEQFSDRVIEVDHLFDATDAFTIGNSN